VTGQIVECEGVGVHLFDVGEGSPLLFLHGAAPAGVWLPFHERLSRGARLVAPDHPGFGLTPRPEWLSGMDDILLHYDALIRQLDLQRPLICGFSLGGWIAAELAVWYPNRFAGVVLFNAAGLHLPQHPLPDLSTLQGEALARALFHRMDTARDFLTPDPTREERRRRYRGLTTLSLLAWNPWFDPELPRRLARIQSTVLVLWGEHDRLIDPAYGEAYRSLIPGARLQLLPGCGHMAHLEDPDAAASAILRFQQELQV